MKTIDITPTWAAIMPVLIACLENGSETGKQMARTELMRAASIIDDANKAALAAEYVELIGYDPFEDDATITYAEVRQTLADYKVEVGL